ncbi:TBC domain protein [Aspergillus sp. HF37]|nr:TBC domain protein [Aspergillus sp. HF37]
MRPTATRKAIGSEFSDRSEGSSPARSSAGPGPRGFEGLLQDVSEGIQRRTETWGVAKAVRGAVTDARRNMHTMQWERERPRATRSEDIPPFAARDVHWAQEPRTAAADLETRIGLLEERNTVLAKMLGQAVNDLRSQMGKVEGADTGTNDGTKQALRRVESVQICLEDSSILLESTYTPSRENDAAHKTQDSQSSPDKTGLPERPSMLPDANTKSKPYRRIPLNLLSQRHHVLPTGRH